MTTRIDGRSPQWAAVSPEDFETLEVFFTRILSSKKVTKGEIKVMGYLVRKALHLGEKGAYSARIREKDWVEEAGLSKNEVDKVLAKCEEKGWITLDKQAKPVAVELRLHG
ncbi:hypothetical protein [Salinithrix halophila]|uniref:MarR family transcriptional regulator n=1 Tax=Salinithrix halophila TaxID=1485204 RepID=A0ABV8JBQ5_9BACL